MNNTRIINVEIRGSDKNVIERDPFAISAENKPCVVVESWEGGVQWKPKEGLVRQGLRRVDVSAEGVGIEGLP